MNFPPSEHRAPKRPKRLLPAVGNGMPSSSSPNTDQAANGYGPNLDNRPLLPKRRRSGVSVACDRCRQKKIRCDGGKPVCSPCHRKGASDCNYEEPAPETNRIGEAVSLLNCLAPAQVNSTLLALVKLKRDEEILTTLREIASLAAQPAIDVSDTGQGFTRMLQAQYPFTYPVFEPIDPDVPSEYLKRLVTPRKRGYHHRENMPAQPDKAHKNDTQATNDASQLAPAPGKMPRDPALHGLDISRWTSVPVTDDFAARAISLYLSTDHMLLCPFDRKLFTKSLVSPEAYSYCSPSLVNALLYWSCQMYTSIDAASAGSTELFRIEAERFCEAEASSATPLSMTTHMFLSLGYLVQGKDHATVRHLMDATNIAIELGLFGVPKPVGYTAIDLMTVEERKLAAHPAWGAFNWVVLMSLFYRQKHVKYPKHPPVLPIPHAETDETDDDEDLQEGNAETIGRSSEGLRHSPEVFSHLCQFWRIMREVTLVYYGDQTPSIHDTASLQFAEYKYRELLAWADALPVVLARSSHNRDTVLILHLWLHSAILDIFRPFLQSAGADGREQELRTFPAADSTPQAAYSASVHQLKQLIITYRSRYTSSSYTILWQTALLYTANAMLHSHDRDRLEYFLICIYSFQGLRQSFRITEAIVQALLAMAIQRGVVSAALAKKILVDLKIRAPEGEQSKEELIRAPFMADLDLSLTDPESSTVEVVADRFDENFDLGRYTMLFEQEE